MKCAVANCEQSDTQRSGFEKNIFYKFPNDPLQLKYWISFCHRSNPIDIKTERICSNHFRKDDFERNLKYEMGFCKQNIRNLKPGVIPTIEAELMLTEIKIEPYDEPIIPEVDDTALKAKIETLKKEIASLRRANRLLQTSQTKSENTIKMLNKQIQRTYHTSESIEKSLKRLFSGTQIIKLKKRREPNWTEEDIKNAISIYNMGPKAYVILRKRRFPIPAIRKLKQWMQMSNSTTKKVGVISNNLQNTEE